MPHFEQAKQAAEEMRQEMKHTPAPWHISESESGGDRLISVDAEHRHITLHTYELPEDMANAKLIAAAPEMLAFVKLVAAGHLSRLGFIDCAVKVLNKIQGQ